MRYFDVITYDFCPIGQNPENKPGYWIWKIINVNQSDPVSENAMRMSLTELTNYKSNHKDSYNVWISQQVSTSNFTRKKVKKAMAAAETMILKYAAENVMNGITQQGKTKLIADAMKDVIYYAQTGSLYEAINALDNVQITESMHPFLTEAKRQELKDGITSLIESI